MVYVFPALTTLPAFVGDTFVYYLIGIAMAFFLAAILTYILGFEDEEVTDELTDSNKKDLELLSCVKGEMIPLEDVKDPVFSSKTMGDGIAIIPEEGVITSPVDGSIEVAFPTGHAVGIKADNNLELLIHVGINTVELNGEHFKMLVKQGDKVKKGQELIKFDIDAIKAKGYDTTTMLLVTNNESGDLKKEDYRNVSTSDRVMQLSLKEA